MVELQILQVSNVSSSILVCRQSRKRGQRGQDICFLRLVLELGEDVEKARYGIRSSLPLQSWTSCRSRVCIAWLESTGCLLTPASSTVMTATFADAALGDAGEMRFHTLLVIVRFLLPGTVSKENPKNIPIQQSMEGYLCSATC